MRFLTIFLIVLGSFDLFAVTLPEKKARITKLKAISPLRPLVSSGKKESKKRSEDVFQKLLEQGKKIDELLKQRSTLPVIWEQRAKILTGKVFRATLLNSINSTNNSSPVLVKAFPNQGLPPETKFTCQGVTAHERVFVLCNKMVTLEKEILITAQVLNRDGSSGLLGEFEDGKDEMITGALISNFTSGVLSSAQSKISGPIGAAREDSTRNQILQGLVESGKTTSDLLTEEMKTKEPILTIEAGAEVLVYFMEGINEI